MYCMKVTSQLVSAKSKIISILFLLAAAALLLAVQLQAQLQQMWMNQPLAEKKCRNAVDYQHSGRHSTQQFQRSGGMLHYCVRD